MFLNKYPVFVGSSCAGYVLSSSCVRYMGGWVACTRCLCKCAQDSDQSLVLWAGFGDFGVLCSSHGGEFRVQPQQFRLGLQGED